MQENFVTFIITFNRSSVATSKWGILLIISMWPYYLGELCFV